MKMIAIIFLPYRLNHYPDGDYGSIYWHRCDGSSGLIYRYNGTFESKYYVSNADITVKPIGATTAPPSYPFRCQIRRAGKLGTCSYYGRWAPSTGDPVILHMDCSIATIIDFSAAGSDGKAYPGYAYENGDVHLIANTSGIDINVFFSFSFIVAE